MTKRKHRIWSRAEIADFASAWKAGMTLADIARHHGRPIGSVAGMLRKRRHAGDTRFAPRRSRTWHIGAELEAFALAWQRGESFATMARRFDCTEAAICMRRSEIYAAGDARFAPRKVGEPRTRPPRPHLIKAARQSRRQRSIEGNATMSIFYGTEHLGEDWWAVAATVDGRGDFRSKARFSHENIADAERDALKARTAELGPDRAMTEIIDQQFVPCPADGSDRLTA